MIIGSFEDNASRLEIGLVFIAVITISTLLLNFFLYGGAKQHNDHAESKE